MIFYTIGTYMLLILLGFNLLSHGFTNPYRIIDNLNNVT